MFWILKYGRSAEAKIGNWIGSLVVRSSINLDFSAGTAYIVLEVFYFINSIKFLGYENI